MERKTSQEIRKVILEEIEICKKPTNDYSSLYKSNCVKWAHQTTDDKRFCTEVISEELLNINNWKFNTITRESDYVAHYDIKNTKLLPKPKPQVKKESEKRRAIRLFKKGMAFNFGEIIEYQVPIKDKRDSGSGEIDLVAYNKTRKILYIIELKFTGNKSDTLLRAILEIETYFNQINKNKFKSNFHRLRGPFNKIEKAVLLYPKCRAYDESIEMNEGNRPKLKELINKLTINVFTVPDQAGD
ncbi:MAG: hypothetical protein HYR80_05865 [Nitrospirae bacterium]|nr:hypothetical protein [Nitrospirota bacterium]